MLQKTKRLKTHPSIFIVEDEPLICATIETALRKQGFKVLGDAENFEEALQSIKNSQPDLVLIDIQLEGIKDGIDLAIELTSLNIPYLYLTSQTDPQTIEKVKRTKPLGYIVKPFTESGLRSNIEIAWHNYASQQDDIIIIKYQGRLHRINQNDIEFLKAFDNYCYVITERQEFLVPHTLKHTFEKLDATMFQRVHRSYVINVNKVSSIDKNSIRINDSDIPVSMRYRTTIKSKIEDL